MEVVMGALPSLIPKLADLVSGEYGLQKEVKGGIIFLQAELESMQGALEKISKTPADKRDYQDKIWARKVRDMSYDIEDTIDTYTVRCKGGRKPAEQHGFKEAIDRTLKWFKQPMIRRNIAKEIREIKSHVEEVAMRRDRYKVNTDVAKPVTVDPRLLFTQYEVKELVGIDEAREEVIQILMEGNDEVSKQHGKIVSIVGFGGLGKTTLADVVYKKIRARFECSAFVSVSQTPDFKKIYKELLYDLGKSINVETLDERRLIELLKEFLQDRRYFVVVDDIWDISIWNMIRCALPDNDVGYIIITTTRISNVAEQASGAYKLKPLSLNNSQKLFFRRIFGSKKKDNNEETEKCPDDELAEVSDKILKKCAGVPLAIITMASLLACKARNKLEWYEVYNSVGIGMENNMDVVNMRKILSFSYDQLPCHLRTCLLYLSMFPEDFEIGKDRLIRMWVAEGFIQCKKQGKSPFELGDFYFSELINRGMIQPIQDSFGMLNSCRIHDMVLDLIRSLSWEENFVTVQSGMNSTSPSNTIRRLSLQNGNQCHVRAKDTRSLLQHARSVVAFSSSIAQVLAPSSCRVLRVLHLRDCNLSQTNSLKYLGDLYHLRYLGLSGTSISQLPDEIGNLQFLQILDVRNNKISSLPCSVVQLRNLMCLYIDCARVPNGIGNLTCLEQLSSLYINPSNINIIEELGQLAELRRLDIQLDKQNDKLYECLCKLQKIQQLDIWVNLDERNIGGLDSWVAPRHLRKLSAQRSCWFSTLPAWVNPLHVPVLTSLIIAVRKLHQVDLEMLGSLPSLHRLNLQVDNKNLGILQGFVVGAGLFPCLVFCYFSRFVCPVVFQQGAMPRLRQFILSPLFYMREGRGIVSSNGALNLGLGNLQSLHMVQFDVKCEGASKEEAKQAKAALRHAAEMHPNHPRHDIYTF